MVSKGSRAAPRPGRNRARSGPALGAALLLAVLALFAASCSSPIKDEVRQKMGALADGVYRNPAFGLEFRAPEVWTIMGDADREALRERMVRQGAEAAFGSGVDIQDAVAFPLVILVRRPMDQVKPGESNPNMMVNAEYVWGRAVPIDTAAQYLETVRTQMGIVFDAAPREVRIGGKVFLGVASTFEMGGGEFVRQSTYVAMSGKYILMIQLNYVADTERAELESLLDRFSFEE